MKIFEFAVNGPPKGKGRPRFTRKGHAYTPATTREFENRVKDAFIGSGGETFGDAPVMMEITALYPIPKSTTKREREAMEQGVIYPMKHSQGDIDNVQKAILDALNRVAYDDDVQVVAIVARKQYDKAGASGAVHIRISDMSE